MARKNQAQFRRSGFRKIDYWNIPITPGEAATTKVGVYIVDAGVNYNCPPELKNRIHYAAVALELDGNPEVWSENLTSPKKLIGKRFKRINVPSGKHSSA